MTTILLRLLARLDAWASRRTDPVVLASVSPDDLTEGLAYLRKVTRTGWACCEHCAPRGGQCPGDELHTTSCPEGCNDRDLYFGDAGHLVITTRGAVVGFVVLFLATWGAVAIGTTVTGVAG